MSSNLRNKKYYFYNESLTKDEYEKRMRNLDFGNYEVFQKLLADFEKLKVNAIHKNTLNERAINVIGDWTIDSRDCFSVKFLTGCERVSYAQAVFGYRDSYDVVFGMSGERCYELLAPGMAEHNFHVMFSASINNSRDLEYCDSCRDCHDCFGCIGLAHRAFCIFNVQYSEDEYWRKIDEIKSAMLAAQEYGEFFLPGSSPFPYTASLATSYRGYDDLREAANYGYFIEEIPTDVSSGVNSMEVVNASALPMHIKEVDDTICEKAIYDEINGKHFRITPYEFAFYRKHNLPLPRLYPIARMNQWRKDLDLRLRFFERMCDHCGKSMMTAYAPDRPEKNIYCEKCYHEAAG